MRGKGNGKEIAHLLHGITPAYAGKSTWKCMPFVTLQDHPRLCGEKSYETSRFLRQIGSPPPMRGKDTAGKVEILAPGITPAYAGKSGKLKKQSKFRQDHPRLCGEKGDAARLAQAVSGSPPPMRGKGIRLDVQTEDGGITPAYAGKSLGF